MEAPSIIYAMSLCFTISGFLKGPREQDPQVQRGGLWQHVPLAQPVDEPRLPAVRPGNGQLVQATAALFRHRRHWRLRGGPARSRQLGRHRPRL